MEHTIKQEDTGPALRVALTHSDGTIQSLTGAAVTFSMRRHRTGELQIADEAAVIVSAATGIAEYQWSVGDTDTPGVYDAEFHVTLDDGSVLTFPSDEYITVRVLPRIA